MNTSERNPRLRSIVAAPVLIGVGAGQAERSGGLSGSAALEDVVAVEELAGERRLGVDGDR